MTLKNIIPIKTILINYFSFTIGRLNSRISKILSVGNIYIYENKKILKLNKKLIYNKFYKYTGRLKKRISYKFYYSVFPRKYLSNTLKPMLSDKYKNNYKNILYINAYF